MASAADQGTREPLLAGVVRAIVTKELILIESDATLEEGDRLQIIERITEVPEDLKSIGVERIDIPKGMVEVVAQQGADMYLARIFRLFERRRRIVGGHVTGIDTLASLLRGGSEEVIEEQVPRGWSAQIDASQAIAPSVTLDVKVGDLAAKV
jgi:hypothetical protein